LDGFLVTKGFKNFDFRKKKKRHIGLAFPPKFSDKYSIGKNIYFVISIAIFFYIFKFIIYIFNKFVSKLSIHDFFFVLFILRLVL
jgi:hypothetical protein